MAGSGRAGGDGAVGPAAVTGLSRRVNRRMTMPCHLSGTRPAWLLAERDTWDDRLPVALWGKVEGVPARRALLRGLVARVLDRLEDDVVIAHAPGEPPRLVAPSATGLSLSSASRAGIAVVAIGRERLGIDVERVDDSHDPPWGVLHPDEVRDLAGRVGRDRAVAFAAIWVVKEAYLKALGTGLAREPANVRVRLVMAASAMVDDEVITVSADLAWRHEPLGLFAVALVKYPARVADAAIASSAGAPGILYR